MRGGGVGGGAGTRDVRAGVGWLVSEVLLSFGREIREERGWEKGGVDWVLEAS